MRENFWWTGTANHLWRSYFYICQNGTGDTPSGRKIHDLCGTVYNRFSERDRAIIKAYYTCKRADAIYAAEDFSARTGISVSTIYSTVRRAGYAVMNELGLIDPERRNTP